MTRYELPEPPEGDYPPRRMNDWRLHPYLTGTYASGQHTAYYIARNGEGGYSVKLLRDIHRALLQLSPEDYAEVRKMLESEEELYE